MTPHIHYEFDEVPTRERVQARTDAAQWLSDNGVPLDGWVILVLETILITGIVPSS